jgi:hypothetical protein
MVVYEQATPLQGSYVVSLSINNVACMWEQRSGDTIVIHVNSSTVILHRLPMMMLWGRHLSK